MVTWTNPLTRAQRRIAWSRGNRWCCPRVSDRFSGMQRNCQCLGRLQGLRAYERVWNMGGLHRYTVGWLPYFTATVQGLELEKTLHPKHLLALHTRPGRASTPTMPAMPPPQPPPPPPPQPQPQPQLPPTTTTKWLWCTGFEGFPRIFNRFKGFSNDFQWHV